MELTKSEKQAFKDMDEEINRIEDEGHPPHCAMRQVWGDGECECDLYKKGYDPYAWAKQKIRGM